MNACHFFASYFYVYMRKEIHSTTTGKIQNKQFQMKSRKKFHTLCNRRQIELNYYEFSKMIENNNSR